MRSTDKHEGRHARTEKGKSGTHRGGQPSEVALLGLQGTFFAFSSPNLWSWAVSLYNRRHLHRLTNLVRILTLTELWRIPAKRHGLVSGRRGHT